MAKGGSSNFNNSEFERAHFVRIEQYVAMVNALYKKAVTEFVRLSLTKKDFDTNKPFSFDDYPELRENANKILRETYLSILSSIQRGNLDAWIRASEKNDKLVDNILKKSKLSKDQVSQYYDRNLDALDAFQKRKSGSDRLGLSERVWNYTKQFKGEIELGIDLGIGEGKSAAAISSDIRNYLQDPSNLFRRVRDKYGSLQLSKRAEQFNPGQGVYRSSYKNALRLTRTEINMAYRTSDHERWNNLDFVVGIEIKLSNNPNHCPTCESLAGKYPKQFKFVGWHPQCRCVAISILKTDEEIDVDDKLLLSGKKPSNISQNSVNEIPEGFKEWIEANKGRAAAAKSQPFFIRDNFKGGKIEGGLKFKTTSGDRSKKKSDSKPKEENKKSVKLPEGIKEYANTYGVNVKDEIFSLLQKNTPFKSNGNGGYFNPEENYVNIPYDQRRKDSKWKAESVIYHEYGHAADWHNGIRNYPEVKALMDKYRQKYSKNNNELYKSIDKKIWDIGYNSAISKKFDDMEKAGAAHDTLMSLNSNFGAGHDKKYFAKKGFSEAEFIAHMFENKYTGNDIFKNIMPDMYEEMLSLADLIVNRITRKQR